MLRRSAGWSLLPLAIVLTACGPDARLVKAVNESDWPVVSRLLQEGANPNVLVEEDPVIFDVVRSAPGEIVQLALEKGAGANARDQFGDTPLVCAARFGRRDAALALIRNGGELNAIGYNGETALIAAAREGNAEIVTLLVENGAQLNLTDELQRTALVHAAKEGHFAVADYLLAMGADLRPADKDGRTYAAYMEEREAELAALAKKKAEEEAARAEEIAKGPVVDVLIDEYDARPNAVDKVMRAVYETAQARTDLSKLRVRVYRDREGVTDRYGNPVPEHLLMGVIEVGNLAEVRKFVGLVNFINDDVRYWYGSYFSRPSEFEYLYLFDR